MSDGYNMSSAEDRTGLIRFPNKTPSSTPEDICIVRLQPARLHGGLTFTESLIIPSPDAHIAVLPCGPYRFVVDTLTLTSASTPNYFPPPSGDRPVLPALVNLLEFRDDYPPFTKIFLVNALGRSALRMLWHQRLGHRNFRKLSELHKHTRGLPSLSLPDVIDDCAVCLASRLRKARRGHTNTMTATESLQGLGIDFAFMIQRSSDAKRFDNLVGHNGETCYVLITDHFSGRMIGHAFATKAPRVDWLNQWLASNAPVCANKYVRMDGGGEHGRCREGLDTFANFSYQTQLTGPASSHQNGPAERPHQTIGDALRAMLTGADLSAPLGLTLFTTLCVCTISSPTGSACPAPMNSAVASYLIYPSYAFLDAASMSARLPLGMAVLFRIRDLVFSWDILALSKFYTILTWPVPSSRRPLTLVSTRV